MKKYFDILGLKQDASQEQIQEAYERLSKTLDPKKNDNLDFFIEEYELVQEAYKFLKKEVKKTPKPKQIAADSIESIFDNLMIQHEVGLGKLIKPVRFALTGLGYGPGIFDMMILLGKDRCLDRLSKAVKL